MTPALQLVEKPLLKATGLHFAGGVRGGGSPFVWNQMPAKSLRQQAFAPRSGRFSGSRAARKSRYCEGVEKVRRTFSTAWNEPGSHDPGSLSYTSRRRKLHIPCFRPRWVKTRLFRCAPFSLRTRLAQAAFSWLIRACGIAREELFVTTKLAAETKAVRQGTGG